MLVNAGLAHDGLAIVPSHWAARSGQLASDAICPSASPRPHESNSSFLSLAPLRFPADLRLTPEQAARGLTALRRKMATYQANAAHLGWLLIPHQQAVEVWSASGDPQRMEGIELLGAGAEFPDLQ